LAHYVGNRVEYLHGFNPARDERGEPAQGGPFGSEPAIVGIQLAIDRVSVVVGSTFLGGRGRESVHDIRVSHQFRVKPCSA